MGNLFVKRLFNQSLESFNFSAVHTSILIIPLFSTVVIRDRREVYLPFKECNSGRGGVKAEPEDHHGHRHFLRHGNFRTDNTDHLRIWNWLPLNNRCLHSPWEVFEVPRGVHPLGSKGRCFKTPACIDLKFKGRWERQRNTRKQRFLKNYSKYDSILGCFIHILWRVRVSFQNVNL